MRSTRDKRLTRLAGRVALVTGATSGIGRATALELACRGCRVFAASRSAAGAQSLADAARAARATGSIEALPLDLADFDSVRRCAESFLVRDRPLHLLINNAGAAGSHELTRSGFEFAFGTNHLGHFLLTRLLLERIKASVPARIVTVASAAHFRVRSIDWDGLRQPARSRFGREEYAVSKLCNVLFSAELGRRLAAHEVTTYSLHPGVVATGIWHRVPWPLRALLKLAMLSPTRGAATTLYCASASETANQTGLYYDERRIRKPSPLAQDPGLAAELWQRSDDWVR